MILLVILVILVALVLFAVWPGAKREDLRAPFYGRNYAHRGYFGKDQRPPENSLPAFAAAARHGYGIELDVQFTSDHKLVVFHDDTLDRMTPKEFDLLVFLVNNKGIALSREKILQQVWNYDYYGEDRTVDTHIKMLRGHLGPCRKFIVTVWGIGYKFDPEVLS